MFAQGSTRSACSIGSTPSSVPSVRRAWRTGVERGRWTRIEPVPNPAARTAWARSGPGLGEVRGQDREAAPGEREPPGGVEAAAEPLEVVGRDDERADGDEARAARSPTRRRPDRRSREAPARAAAASATSVARGIRVLSGRPLSSSSACAATPSASANARHRPEHPVGAEMGRERRRRARRRRGSRRCTGGGARSRSRASRRPAARRRPASARLCPT